MRAAAGHVQRHTDEAAATKRVETTQMKLGWSGAGRAVGARRGDGAVSSGPTNPQQLAVWNPLHRLCIRHGLQMLPYTWMVHASSQTWPHLHRLCVLPAALGVQLHAPGLQQREQPAGGGGRAHRCWLSGWGWQGAPLLVERLGVAGRCWLSGWGCMWCRTHGLLHPARVRNPGIHVPAPCATSSTTHALAPCAASSTLT